MQLSPHQIPAMQTSQIDAMARQVQQLFPHIPFSLIVDDVRLSHSVELTVENILDGRIVIPPHVFQRDPIPPGTAEVTPEPNSEVPSSSNRVMEVVTTTSEIPDW